MSGSILELVYRFVRNFWPALLSFAITGYLGKNYFNNGLQKYPGPKLAAISDWWRFFDVKRGRHQHTQIALHKEHGDIVRLGPNSLAFANPKAIKDIYGLNKGFVKVNLAVCVGKGVSDQSVDSILPRSKQRDQGCPHSIPLLHGR